VEQPRIRDFVGERVLEGIFQVRREPRLVEEVCSLQAGELGPYLVLRRFGNG
jgi:hypothetical protein